MFDDRLTKFIEGKITCSSPDCRVKFEMNARKYGNAIAGAFTLGNKDSLNSSVISSSNSK